MLRTAPVLASALICFSSTLFAHGGGHPTRYIAEDGYDSGNCAEVTSPCKSIRYAVNQSSKGEKIKLSAGTYHVEGDDIFFLLSDMIELKGGFSREDDYQTFNPAKNITTIVGLPARFRDELSDRGFKLLQDVKGKDIRLSLQQNALLNVFYASTEKTEGKEACVDGKAGHYPCDGISMLSHMPLSQFSSKPSSANDIWGFVDLNDKREYALIGLENGTAVVDVTDPEKPREVGTIRGRSSTWRDVKVYQYFNQAKGRYEAYAYVTTEAVQGLQVIDLTNLPESISLVNTYDEFKTAHNIYMANIDYATGVPLDGMKPYAYVLGSNLARGAFRVLDLTNPAHPTLVTSPPLNTQYIHDATTFVLDDERTASCKEGHNPCEIFVDFNENTVDIWDMTDKQNPHMISSTGYQGASYTHSGWWSKDKKYIFVHDELDEQNLDVKTTLRTLDISNLSQPFISNVWVGPTSAIDHNGFVKGDRYYMSNYRRGLTVLDIADPNAPKEIAFFDTFPAPSENSANFNGAWGTYPYLPSGNIIVSDIEYGLYVLKEDV